MTSHIVDTNILIRLITYDVPGLAREAQTILASLADDSVELPQYVLAEVVYVLGYNPNYQYDRSRISQSLATLIEIPQFTLNREVANKALFVFKRTKLDFVDCLLLCQAKHSGQKLFTFDKKLIRELAK